MSLIRALESGSILHYCRSGRRVRFSIWVIAGCAFFLLTSCNSKKYLREDQSFLKYNEIKIKSEHKIDDKSDLEDKLTTLYRQPATKGIIPRHVFYYQYLERLERDSIRKARYISKGLTPPKSRKPWSEEKLIKNRPVIYDSVKAQLTTEAFEKYLNLRGYRTAEASFSEKTKDKETTVYYRVDPGPRIYIDTLIIATNDSSLRNIINARLDKTNFPEGSPLDIELYNKEKVRLVNDFQNQGYARFDETFIAPMEVDTAGNFVKATVRVLDVNDSTFHKKYYVGDVTIYPDYSLTDTSALHDTIVRGVRYISPEPDLTLKPEAIERNLFLRKGDLTRRENISQTLKNLSRMELIRFVTPVDYVDSIQRDTPYINYTLFLNRNKKLATNGFVELTYANIGSTLGAGKRYLLGTSASVNYRDRNLFKGAEILDVNLEYGIEFNFFNRNTERDRSAINSENLSAGSNLSFPRFIDPLGLYKIIGHSKEEDQPGMVKNKIRRWFLYDANTRLNLSYNRVDIRELYKYYSINAAMNYDIIPDNYRKLTIDRIGVDLYVPTPTLQFDTLVLSKSKLLRESFGKYLFTGLLFRKYAYDFKAPPRRKAGYFSLLHGFEISGLEVALLNLAFEKEFTIGHDDPSTPQSELLEFSHFAKAEIDLRFYYDISSSTQFVIRFNTGVATPLFNQYSQQVPYIKQFYVGGPLSNRAWQIRELGPGSYNDTSAIDQFAFYQTGDIKLDMSAELRFPLFWYFDGAVFIDAANVWAIRDDEARPGAVFEPKDFLQELGIGYGFGIRLDLDYFIIRLDLGFKLLSPYRFPETGSRRYPKKFLNGGIAQIAVGLPF